KVAKDQIRGDFGAIDYFHRAIKYSPNHLPSYVQLARVLLQARGEGDEKEADGVMDLMIKNNPKDHRAHLAHAQFLQLRSRNEEAYKAVAKAYELAPKAADSIMAMAQIAMFRGKLPEARKLLEGGID